MQIFIRAKIFTSLVILISALSVPAMAWDLDLSRRQKFIREKDARMPSSETGELEKEPDMFSQLFPHIPQQEIVVLNTEKGFIPNSLRLRKGGRYTIHIVNISEKDKNISFVLESFAQYHGMFFGKQKSFVLEPKQEGIFSFVSPETAAEGRVVVFDDAGTDLRTPAAR